MSSIRTISRTVSGGAALAVLGAGLLMGPSAGAAVVPGSYQARASTAGVPVTSSQTTVALTFINDSPTDSFDFLHHATATFPAGFSGLSGPSSATASDGTGTTFAVTYSGLTVTLDSAIGLAPTEGEVTVAVSITTPAYPGVYALSTTASGTVGDAVANGAYTRNGAEPAVTVGPAANTTYCLNGATCDTGFVGSETNTLARIVTTGAGNDAVTLVLNEPVYTCPGGEAQGMQATYTTQNLTRTVTGTLELDKSIVNAKSDNGASHYNICYQGKRPFTQADGSPAAPRDDFFVGFLPRCSSNGNLAPCLLKISKTGAGDLLGTFLGEAGDPGPTWEYLVAPPGIGAG